MVNLKSVALRLLASLFFTIAFTVLFFTVIVALVPGEWEGFAMRMEQQLPGKILDSNVLGSAVPSAGADASSKAQMELGLREGIRTGLEPLGESVGQVSGMLPWLVVLFAVAYTAGALVLAADDWNGFVPALVAYTARFLAIQALSLGLLWLLVPYSAGWLAGQVEQIAGAQLGADAEGVPLEPLVQVVMDFFLKEMQIFLLKPLAVYAILAMGMVVASHRMKKPATRKRG